LRRGEILHAGQTQHVFRRDVLKDLYGIALTLVKRKGRYWPLVK
jgi:ABC-type cobalamin transport system ATPase subunit